MNHLHPDIPDMEDAVLSIAFSDPPNLKWELSLKELVLQSQHVPGENSGSGTTAVYESIPGIRLIYRKSKVPTEIHCSFKLQADRPFQIQSAQLIIPLKDGTPNHMFCNGWQSWTESRVFRTDERILPPRWPLFGLFAPYGDYRVHEYSEKTGHLHSWSWATWNSTSGASILIGSLDENAAYTGFELKASEKTLRVFRDIPTNWVAAKTQQGYFERWVLNFMVATGTPDDVYDSWFNCQTAESSASIAPTSTGHPAAEQPPSITGLPHTSSPISLNQTPHKETYGWTSWYRYYTKIDEKKLALELDHLHRASAGSVPFTWFQIDDGWQPRVGDWLECNNKFPNGLSGLAKKAREMGFKPGLWLAPFIAEKSSDLLRKHPDWAERDPSGRLVPAGYTPLWSGTFYALNPDHPGLRDHIRKVFHQILDEWGFDLVKLDFLYAAALQHGNGRARAERMRSAMKFLRACVGDRAILACGVPLSSAFGLVDYCRIGADVHLSWEHALLAWFRNRERVSTWNALQSTIGRRYLNQRAFINDPDVFLLRMGDRSVSLSPGEQYTLLLCNRLFGGVLFTSDDLSQYKGQAAAWFKEAFPPLQTKPDFVKEDHGRIATGFSVEGERYLALINLSDHLWSAPLQEFEPSFGGKAAVQNLTNSETLSSSDVLAVHAHASIVAKWKLK